MAGALPVRCNATLADRRTKGRGFANRSSVSAAYRSTPHHTRPLKYLEADTGRERPIVHAVCRVNEPNGGRAISAGCHDWRLACLELHTEVLALWSHPEVRAIVGTVARLDVQRRAPAALFGRQPADVNIGVLVHDGWPANDPAQQQRGAE